MADSSGAPEERQTPQASSREDISGTGAAPTHGQGGRERHDGANGPEPSLFPGPLQPKGFDLIADLTRRGRKFVDMRPKGGLLWVIGGTELEHQMFEYR